MNTNMAADHDTFRYVKFNYFKSYPKRYVYENGAGVKV